MTISQFWDSTLEEIKQYVESFQRKRKSTIADLYTEAQMVAMFVNKSMNGKQVPPIYDLFPEMFADEKAQATSEQQMAFLCERFKVFADQRNAEVSTNGN